MLQHLFTYETFLFGAGASIPYFDPRLTTKYLTEQISNQLNWEEVVTKYKSISGKETVKPEIVCGIIDTILKISPASNFEQIAEVIDKIASINYNMNPNNNLINLLLVTLKATDICSDIKTMLGWRDIPFLFRQIIAEVILKLENQHLSLSHNQLINMQHDFIEYVTKMDDSISVVSLNYDNNVLKSLVELGFEKGCKPTNEHYGLQLDVDKFMNCNKVAYFPHGHLRFCLSNNNNVTYYSDSNTANDERWNGTDSIGIGSTLTLTNGKFAYNFNTFLTTGQTKDDTLNTLPYAIYYQRLALDIANSDTIYIIGYSFGDEHINRLLKSFIKKNNKNKVYIIDFYNEDVSMTVEYQEQSNLINKIHSVFNTEWSVYVDGDGYKYPINQQEVNNLNSKGFGEIFRNVIFYKKGYDAFLKEYNTII